MYFLVLLMSGLSVFVPSTSYLFREYKYPTYHTHYTITKEALARVAVRYITGNSDSPDNVPVNMLNEIFEADDDFAEAADDIISSMSDRYRDIYQHPTLLMTDELITEGNEYLLTTRKTIVELAKKDRPDILYIRQLIGYYLLTLQMFYCNTNWVEIMENKICQTLGVTDEFDIPLSTADEATCSNCEEQRKDDCKDNLLLDNTLTSGYFGIGANGGDKPYNLQWGRTGKCSHGGTLDHSRSVPATGGINKETPEYTLSPHYFLHKQSGNAALTASIHFLIDKDIGLLTVIGKQHFENILSITYQAPVTRNETVNETDTTKRNVSLTPHTVVHRLPPLTIKTVYKPACYECFQSSLSLVFIIDNTGSMSDDIFQVRKQAIEIVNKASSSQQGLANYVLVTFNDPAYKNTLFKTVDGTSMVDKLNRLLVDGGGDCPEYAFTGLKTGIQNANPGSCVFLFTDADPKDFSMCNEIGVLIKKKNIRLVTFLTGRCNGVLNASKSGDCIPTEQQPFSCSRRQKRSTSEETSSGMFSGLGGIVIAVPDRQITAPLQTLLEKNLDIQYVYIAQINLDADKITFPVDDYLTVLVVEIIGTYIKNEISFLEPNDTMKTFTGRDTLEYVGKNTFIASILNPKAGHWTLLKHSGRDWVVHVKGQGNVEMKVKLMERRDESLLDISGKPVSGHTITIAAEVKEVNKTSEIDYIVIYSENHTEIDRQLATIYMDFDAQVAVADFQVPYQKFWVAIEGHEGENIFQRTTENIFKPSMAGLKILSTKGELYPNIESNVSCIVSNYGSRNEIFSVRANDDMSFLLSPNSVQISLESGESKSITFHLRGGTPKSLTTLTVSVQLLNGQTIQEKTLKLRVTEFVPPTLRNITMSEMCSASTLNFENCSNEIIQIDLDIISTSELKYIYCKPKSVQVHMDNTTIYGLQTVQISGDCCMPKFRLFVKDKNNLLVQKAFDFTDGKTFSNVLPEIQHPEVKDNIKTTSVSKAVIYGPVGGAFVAFVAIVIIISVMISKKRSKNIVI